jgi:ketosteroid isomerase-like protein
MARYFAAMEQHNVDIVTRASALVSASCQTGVAGEELLALCSPDIRIDASRRVFNPDVYDGRDGMRRMVREVHDAWEDFAETDVEILDAGERVLALHRIIGRGRASGIAVESDGALVCTVRDGLIARVDIYADRGEALASVGRAG